MNLAPSWYLPTKSNTPDSMVIVSGLENIDFWGFREPRKSLFMWGGGRGIGPGTILTSRSRSGFDLRFEDRNSTLYNTSQSPMHVRSIQSNVLANRTEHALGCRGLIP